jgi:hypothetical protein
MKSSQEIKELEKLSSDLAPKSGCRVCRLVLVAAAILFISSVLLAAFALGRQASAPEIDNVRIQSVEASSDHVRDLQQYLASKKGSTTLIIGKTKTK